MNIYNNSIYQVLKTLFPLNDWNELQNDFHSSGSQIQSLLFSILKKYFNFKEIIQNFKHPSNLISFFILFFKSLQIQFYFNSLSFF